MLNTAFQVMIGGGIGAVLRYLCTLWLPMPILIVNILGSLLIGYFYAKFSSSHPQYLPFLNTGLMGGLTTFSAFSLELVNFISSAQFLKALGYALASLIICFIACFFGMKLA